MDYELPLQQEKNAKDFRILAFDPGSRNMGISLVNLHRDTHEIRVLANATMSHPISDVKCVMKQRDKFEDEVSRWVSLFSPNAIIAERFQSRGLMGTTVECVGIMLGILLQFRLPTKFITAATWKNNFQKRFGVNLRDTYKTIPTTPHQLDSSLIGCYGLEICCCKELNFALEDIIVQVAVSSLVPLRRKFRV